ncbi:MAG: heme o synthase [Pelagibacteraceae bacterium]|nr:heme o synthase [Pelagibacteraceae bacterium]MBO6466210.1 heme o synthase [Pelagibacteraceae bacterium]MBO6467789.1 heme o synthase [Pelagibacteraceae bacterium]MBO6468620.1 heme o synthase [Pelagibacteraceae bacterium]MBO6479304.1 heme o synthase [Pelagibacteraceae bacterium]
MLPQTALINTNFFTYSRSFYQLMKPRVMSLVIFTCVVGLIIAPTQVGFFDASLSIMAVALGAGAAGALNMWYEADLDALMKRTCLRPIPTGKVTKNQALIFGIVTSFVSVITLYFFSNLLSATMLFFTIFFYTIIYTIWLKPKTSQNIVIGGVAGALPPVIGWTIVTGNITLEPILLFLIIFFWTPSHFWALSLYKTEDYNNAKIPMLPVVAGIKTTKTNIFVYAVILFIVSLSPAFFGYFGLIYLLSSFFLGSYYVYLCYKLLTDTDNEKKFAKKIFVYSILYLFLIFSIIIVDNIIQ